MSLFSVLKAYLLPHLTTWFQKCRQTLQNNRSFFFICFFIDFHCLISAKDVNLDVSGHCWVTTTSSHFPAVWAKSWALGTACERVISSWTASTNCSKPGRQHRRHEPTGSYWSAKGGRVTVRKSVPYSPTSLWVSRQQAVPWEYSVCREDNNPKTTPPFTPDTNTDSDTHRNQYTTRKIQKKPAQ